MNYDNYNARSTLRLINLLFFWEPFNLNDCERQEMFKNVVKTILLALIASIKNLATLYSFKIPKLDGEIVFAYHNKPSNDVLINLKTHFNSTDSVTPNEDLLKNEDLSNLMFGYFALYYTLHHLYWYFFLKGYDRRAYRSKFWHCFYDLGRYRYVYLQLKRSKKVKMFIGSNDHIGYSQMGFVAAKKLGIKTVYIQHASVTEKFPPLMVDLALLDGKDSMAKYRIAPKQNVKIELIGSLKYDNFIQRSKVPPARIIVGVCVNYFQADHPLQLQLCEELSKANVPFIIRFHPHLVVHRREVFMNEKWLYSSDDEKECEFILKCSHVVSEDSNILLDTLVLHRTPIYYKVANRGVDYYGFLANGLVEKRYTNINDVFAYINEKQNNILEQRKRAKYYIDTLYTDNEGMSLSLAVKHIQSFVEEL